MNARERFEAAAALFLEAENLPPGTVDEFLRARCGGDEVLLAQVRALLKGREAPDVFDSLASRLKPIGDELRADGQAMDVQGLPGRLAEELPGSTVGKYRLVEVLGEGGFGRVWVAEQTEPVRRQVAIKILKAGMDSREVLARFEAERQALAFLNHPNIAKVFDAGATAQGRPYFVMELVPGSSITEFCDAQHLAVRARLELFIPICMALQHAHQRGIIHRDLKPSNILVTLVDGAPAPKIIDFGIAKATASPLTESTLVTAAGRMLGTPEYMSPEQASSGGADIDTRSDIYSLGVILYQLLTGTLPFDTRTLRAAGYEGMLRVIREQEPPKPSTRLSTLIVAPSERRDERPPVVGQGPDTRAVVREVRGELDWIVMKCLEKDRDRRYESAESLGADLQRYLDGDPVIAAPPSRAYQLKKIVQRHGLIIGASSSVVVALMLGLGASLYLYANERDARKHATDAEAESKLRADNLQKVADFQAQMLAQVDPTSAGVRLSEDVTARFKAALAKAQVPEDQLDEQVNSFAGLWGRVNATDAAQELIDRTILRPAVEAIGKQFADQPTVAATLRDALAERYNELGVYDVAVSLERQALDERRRVLGDDHADTLASISNMSLFLQNQGKLSDSEKYAAEALERSRRVFGEEDPRTLNCLSRMGSVLNLQGKRAEAEPFYRDTLEKRRRVLGEEHPDTLTAMTNMGALRRDQGRLADAEPLYADALEKRRRILGEDHLDTLNSVNNLGGLLRDLGKTEQAAVCFREVVEKRRRILGEAHPSTLSAIRNLGVVLAARGELREAEALQREALSNQQRLLGADHPGTIVTLSNLGIFLMEHGDPTIAEQMCREALERNRRVLGENHPSTLISNNVMAFVLRRQNRPVEAEPYVRETLAIGRRVLGSLHPDTLIYAHNLGALLLELKKPAESEPLFREVIDTGESVLGKDHQLVLSATSFLGAAFIEMNRSEEAAKLLEGSEAVARTVLTGPNERALGIFLMTLGKARSVQGNLGPAESSLLEAHAIIVKTRGASHKDTRSCTQAIADLYSKWSEADPSAERKSQAAEWTAKLQTFDSSGR